MGKLDNERRDVVVALTEFEAHFINMLVEKLYLSTILDCAEFRGTMFSENRGTSIRVAMEEGLANIRSVKLLKSELDKLILDRNKAIQAIEMELADATKEYDDNIRALKYRIKII